MRLEPVQATPFEPTVPEISDVEAAALARTTVNLVPCLETVRSAGPASCSAASPPVPGHAGRRGNAGRVSRDLKMRDGASDGHFTRGFAISSGTPCAGYEWIRAENSAFAGKSALEMMLRGELSDLAAMREWLDAERGAW